MKYLWFICGFVFPFLLAQIMMIHDEKKAYNNGYCPRCGKKLRLYCAGLQGGRGYFCDDCKYSAWVSHKCVDEEQKNERN